MNSWVVDQALDLEKSYPGEKKKKRSSTITTDISTDRYQVLVLLYTLTMIKLGKYGQGKGSAAKSNQPKPQTFHKLFLNFFFFLIWKRGASTHYKDKSGMYSNSPEIHKRKKKKTKGNSPVTGLLYASFWFIIPLCRAPIRSNCTLSLMIERMARSLVEKLFLFCIFTCIDILTRWMVVDGRP